MLGTSLSRVQGYPQDEQHRRMNDTGRPSFSERDLFAPVTGIEVARCTVVDQCRLRSEKQKSGKYKKMEN